MSLTHCDACHRRFKVKGGETQRTRSGRTNRYYCPVSDETKCKAERRRLIKTGQIDLEADNRAVREAMARAVER